MLQAPGSVANPTSRSSPARKSKPRTTHAPDLRTPKTQTPFMHLQTKTRARCVSRKDYFWVVKSVSVSSIPPSDAFFSQVHASTDISMAECMQCSFTYQLDELHRSTKTRQELRSRWTNGHKYKHQLGEHLEEINEYPEVLNKY